MKTSLVFSALLKILSPTLFSISIHFRLTYAYQTHTTYANDIDSTILHSDVHVTKHTHTYNLQSIHT